MTWLTGWQYRRSITLTEQSGSDLTDYQVKIELNSSNFDFSKANADGSDIRFAADDGTTLLPYWIEEWDSVNQTAKIWVKIPSLLANSSITIYMYYGNPDAISESNPDAVFDFYDDFEGTSLDTSKWSIEGSPNLSFSSSVMTISGNSGQVVSAIESIKKFGTGYILEVYVNQNFARGNHGGIGFAESPGYTYPPVTNVAQYVDLSSGDDYIGFIIEDGANRNLYSTGSYTGGWTTFILIRKDTEVYFKFANYEWTSTQYLPKGDLPVRVGGYRTSGDASFEYIFYVDWVRVRKYADVEPTFTVSAEEAPIISGIVKLSDGTPVSGATVICIREDTYTIVGVTTSQTDGSYAVSAAGGVKNTVIVIPSNDTQNGDIKCHIVP